MAKVIQCGLRWRLGRVRYNCTSSARALYALGNPVLSRTLFARTYSVFWADAVSPMYSSVFWLYPRRKTRRPVRAQKARGLFLTYFSRASRMNFFSPFFELAHWILCFFLHERKTFLSIKILDKYNSWKIKENFICNRPQTKLKNARKIKTVFKRWRWERFIK